MRSTNYLRSGASSQTSICHIYHCQELEFTSWYSVSAKDGDNVDNAGDMIVTQILKREVGLEKMTRWGDQRGIKLRGDKETEKRKKKCCKG